MFVGSYQSSADEVDEGVIPVNQFAAEALLPLPITAGTRYARRKMRLNAPAVPATEGCFDQLDAVEARYSPWPHREHG